MNTHDRERESCIPLSQTAFLTLTPSMRRLLEAAAEDALNFAESMSLFLDECDGDPDAEPDDPAEANGDEMEPSLGSLGSSGTGSHIWAGGTADDLEDEHDGSEPDIDGEPDSDAEPDCDRELDRADEG